MPVKPRTPCRRSGCPALVDKPGFCTLHQREAFKAQKLKVDVGYAERNRFYQRKEWKSVRALQLSLEPLCRECRKSGRFVAAVIVDHVVPIADGGAMLDLNNLQSLCKPCHDAKTRREHSNRVGAVQSLGD